MLSSRVGLGAARRTQGGRPISTDYVVATPDRRAVLGGASAVLGTMLGTSTIASPARGTAGFDAFVQSLWPEASAKGVDRDIFDRATARLVPDEDVPRASDAQPEFERPVQSYVQDAVSPGRVARGRTLVEQYASTPGGVAGRFGVPAEIALAAWAMESDYGRVRGTHDVVRTLATLAYTRAERPVFRDEVLAALVILQGGTVPRERLVGSWAGAMGDPQFLPSAYLKYAVSAGGEGAPDIWTNPADTLASIANFLRMEGWAPGQPWIEAVVTPRGFAVPTLHADAARWAALGLRRADGGSPAGDGTAALFMPAGASGPAFLLYPNYFVIKRYNNSDAYALSLGLLARRIAGAAPPETPWPTRPVSLSRADRVFIQDRLAALGLYDGARDGKFGPKARDAVHAYQRQAGLSPADGFATPALVASLRRP